MMLTDDRTTYSFQQVPHNSQLFWKTVDLRDELLRQPLNLQFTKDELLAEGEQYHLAYTDGTDVLACLVLVPKDNGYIKMRQVAVREALQGKGIGRELVQYSEKFACQMGFTTMECNARDVAIPFYEKLGYHKVGEPFYEVTILHYRMEKVLS